MMEELKIETLTVLEPGKVYCLQVDMALVYYDHLEALMDGLSQQNIKLAVIDKNMNFVSVPEGYEVTKKK